MKKIKLLAPIIATTAIATPIVASCSNNANTVVLQAGQTLDRTVTANSATVAFYFKQQNPSTPKDTKVYLREFSINGTEQSAPSGTIKYVADSAGNMRVIVDVKAILASFSNTTKIAFKLLFKNDTAKTSREMGPFSISIDDEEGEDLPEIFVPEEVKVEKFTTSFDNVTALCTFNLTGAGYLPFKIKVIGDNETLNEGEDYIYFMTNSGKTGNVWFANSFDNVKIELDTVETATSYRDHIPFGNDNDTWTNNILIVNDINDDFDLDLDGQTVTKNTFNTWLIKRKNNTQLVDPAFQSFDDRVKAFKFMKNTMDSLYNDESIDQSISYLVIQYEVYAKDEESTYTYYGSCAIRVNKNPDTPVEE